MSLRNLKGARRRIARQNSTRDRGDYERMIAHKTEFGQRDESNRRGHKARRGTQGFFMVLGAVTVGEADRLAQPFTFDCTTTLVAPATVFTETCGDAVNITACLPLYWRHAKSHQRQRKQAHNPPHVRRFSHLTHLTFLVASIIPPRKG